MAPFHRIRCGALTYVLALTVLALPRISPAAQVSYRADAPVTGDTQVDYYADAAGALGLNDLMADASRYLRPLHASSVHFGLSTSAYWLHWSLKSRAAAPTVVYLSIAQPTLEDVRLYVVQNGVVRQQQQAGSRVPAREQVVAAGHPVLPIELAPEGKYELYLRVTSRMGMLLVPLRLESAADLEHSQRASLLLNGLISGAFGALLVYNLLLFASLRHRAYLFYVLLLPATYLACTVIDGFGPWMLYPSWTWPSNQGLMLFAGASFALNMLFARALLQTVTIPRLDRWLLTVAAVSLATALCCWLPPTTWLYRLTALLCLVTPVSGAVAGCISLQRAHPQARFFVLAQAAVWIGMGTFMLSSAGVIGFGPVVRQGITLGVTLNALLLSLALADRIRALKQTTERAESNARQILERRQQELERTVAERTQQLDQARRHAEYLAVTDALTGIYNRRGLLPLVQTAIERAQAEGTPLTLICFDLDHFKHINDDFGHAEGDRVLCDLVSLTRKHVRQSDLLGRTGGEEFMLALGVPLASAVQRAQELREHLQQHLKAGRERRPVTASFGVATLGPEFNSLEVLQQAADAALYRAKRRGSNRVEVYDEKDEASMRTRAMLRPKFGSSARLRPPKTI